MRLEWRGSSNGADVLLACDIGWVSGCIRRAPQSQGNNCDAPPAKECSSQTAAKVQHPSSVPVCLTSRRSITFNSNQINVENFLEGHLASLLSGMMSSVLSRDAKRLATRENNRQHWVLHL